MAEYDRSILRMYADKMYARADNVIRSCCVVGLLVGGVSGFAIQGLIYNHGGLGATVWIISILGVVLGYMVGNEKAFWIKLEAQKLLCALQTEINTSPSFVRNPTMPDPVPKQPKE